MNEWLFSNFLVYLTFFSFAISFPLLWVGVQRRKHWARLSLSLLYFFIATVILLINFLVWWDFAKTPGGPGLAGIVFYITIPIFVVFIILGLLCLKLEKRWARLMLAIIFLIMAIISWSLFIGVLMKVLSNSVTGYGMGLVSILFVCSLLLSISIWSLLSTKLEERLLKLWD